VGFADGHFFFLARMKVDMMLYSFFSHAHARNTLVEQSALFLFMPCRCVNDYVLVGWEGERVVFCCAWLRLLCMRVCVLRLCCTPTKKTKLA